MHDKQNVIGHESTGCPDLNREEVRGGHDVPMRFQESLPRGAFRSLRRGFDTMPFQYILDRVRCDDVTEIGQRALDSVVAR